MNSCKKCGKEFPNRLVVDGKKRNLSKRKFCLVCSPFGKNNTLDLSKIDEHGKKCCKCNLYKPWDEFYKSYGKKRTRKQSYCKVCHNDLVKNRLRLFKEKCVEYKGGKCNQCGYNKYIGALEFHHLDPKEKDFTFSKVSNHTFDAKIKNELDKCVLLCANCHRETHREN